MKTHPYPRLLLCGLLIVLRAPRLLAAEPTAANLAAFHRYTQSVEARLAQQHRTTGAFLAPALGTNATTNPHLRNGDLLIDHIDPPTGADLNGALLHHWRGTAFVLGATAAGFERLLRDFSAYPQRFAPQVTAAHIVSQSGPAATPNMLATMRIRQRHVITVVMDTTYAVAFGQLDAQHGYSISQSTRIAEIDAPGTPAEHALSPADDHGFLWRLNTYWSFEERDGGLYLQIESVSLTRAIPSGLGWIVKPYVESIPRESLEFTLRSAATALRG